MVILGLVPAMLLGAMLAAPVAYAKGRAATADDLRIIEGLRLARSHVDHAIGTSPWPEPVSPRLSDRLREPRAARAEPHYVPRHTAAGRRWVPERTHGPRDVDKPVRAAFIASRPPIWLEPATIVIGRPPRELVGASR